jgi:EAL domain-containing protein (putative c-di-GMP-specific phosphodiesterase class I)
MPLDKLKIDKCFVDDCENMRSASIIHALVALARAVGLKVTAEGVETEGQHRVLRAAGVHYMQGFLFAGAVSADGITRLIADVAAHTPRPNAGTIRAVH